MLYILLIILVALLVWLILKPAWMPAPPKNALTEQVVKQADHVGQASASWVARARSWWKKPVSLGAQLKAWAMNEDVPTSAGFSPAQATDLARFRAWIVSLSDAEVDLLAKELETFCHKQDVNVRWLLDDQGRGDMQTTLAALVLFYGLAVRERINALPAAAVREWEESPLARQNLPFGTRLFTSLVEAEQVSIPASLLFASEKKRLAHMVNAIKAALVKDREAVLMHAAHVLEDQRAAKKQKTKAIPAAVEGQQAA